MLKMSAGAVAVRVGAVAGPGLRDELHRAERVGVDGVAVQGRAVAGAGIRAVPWPFSAGPMIFGVDVPSACSTAPAKRP